MKVLKPNKKTTKAKEKAYKKLPPDTYKPLFDPSVVEIDENRQVYVNVQRGGEEGLPLVDIRIYQTTEAYTGFTKKGINIPLSMLPDLLQTLQDVSDTAEEKGLYEEYEE